MFTPRYLTGPDDDVLLGTYSVRHEGCTSVHLLYLHYNRTIVKMTDLLVYFHPTWRNLTFPHPHLHSSSFLVSFNGKWSVSTSFELKFIIVLFMSILRPILLILFIHLLKLITWLSRHKLSFGDGSGHQNLEAILKWILFNLRSRERLRLSDTVLIPGLRGKILMNVQEEDVLRIRGVFIVYPV